MLHAVSQDQDSKSSWSKNINWCVACIGLFVRNGGWFLLKCKCKAGCKEIPKH